MKRFVSSLLLTAMLATGAFFVFQADGEDTANDFGGERHPSTVRTNGFENTY